MDMSSRRDNGAGSRLRRMAATGMLVVGTVVMLTSQTATGVPKADPKGNNGTIKIDGVSLQGGQRNEPHVDCDFALEFFGYDKGDLQAKISFELQAPTRRPSGSQVLLEDTLAIGEDAAGGATDLDASKVYRLDFSGVTPQAKQGYHVKVTVNADGSQGADKKHKVFWVQPCEVPTTTTTTVPSTSTTTVTTAPTTTTTAAPTTPTTAAVLGATTSTVPTEVKGEQVERPVALPRTGASSETLSFLGGLLLVIGGLALLLSRPRRLVEA
jgi:LPXTG-motif cell wall-anchored protein